MPVRRAGGVVNARWKYEPAPAEDGGIQFLKHEASLDAAPAGVHCEGCGMPTWATNNPCWECVKARARAATTGGRCKCGRKRRERVVETRVRCWVSCERCLGVVRQLPDRGRS